MSKTPTIYDVADKAGVSITTVSRVLNSPSKVKPSSREKVMQAMKDLNFVPRADAAARARKDFKRIGVLVPFFTAPSFVQRLRNIAEAISATDYELIIYSVETQEQLSGYLSMLPISNRIDGLIILALPVTEDQVDHLLDHSLPTILVEISNPRLSSIEIDNYEGGRIAAEYLLSRGYKNLGFLGEGGEPAYSLHATGHRYEGYKQYLSEKGVVLKEDFTVFHKYGMKYAVESAKKLLTSSEPPDAIFATSDIQAVGVLKAARELGLAVPGDIAVLGFDDIDMADYMGLTTISQELDQSGRTAAELLIEKMKSPSNAVKHISFQLKIIERNSV